MSTPTDGHVDLLGGLKSSRIILRGANFSGRTDALKAFAGQPRANVPGDGAYIGPEIYNCLSGLAATVEQELELHALRPGRIADGRRLFDTLGLSPLYQRNPFTLSGGEQAILAIACGALLDPTYLAIDCAFEQVDPNFRIETVRLLEHPDFKTSCALADNRLSEYEFPPSAWETVELQSVRKQDYGSLDFECAGSKRSGLNADTVIAFDDVSFRYTKGANVLNNAGFQMEPGKVYLLSGKNGAGKSTLAKLLAGVIRPTNGRILINNRNAEPWRSPGTIVGYHFQNPDVQLFATTVKEELILGLRGAEPSSATLEPVVDLFQLRGVLGEHPLDLPFVIRKRVAMAATLVMPVPWFILDEPTLGQDTLSIRTIATVLNELAASGRGIVVITHSKEFKALLNSPRSLHISAGSVSVCN